MSTTRIEFPKFQTKESRLESLDRYPKDYPSKEKLAEAGFFYSGNGVSDDCQCYYCGTKLIRWSPNDDPVKEHRTFKADCPLLSSKSVIATKVNPNFEVNNTMNAARATNSNANPNVSQSQYLSTSKYSSQAGTMITPSIPKDYLYKTKDDAVNLSRSPRALSKNALYATNESSKQETSNNEQPSKQVASNQFPNLQSVHTNLEIQNHQFMNTNSENQNYQSMNTNPENQNYQPMNTNPENQNYQPMNTNPENQNYQSMHTNMENHNYQSMYTNTENQNIQPMNTNPENQNYQSMHTNMENQNYQPMNTNPENQNYQSMHTNTVNQNFQSGQIEQEQSIQTDPSFSNLPQFNLRPGYNPIINYHHEFDVNMSIYNPTGSVPTQFNYPVRPQVLEGQNSNQLYYVHSSPPTSAAQNRYSHGGEYSGEYSPISLQLKEKQQYPIPSQSQYGNRLHHPNRIKAKEEEKQFQIIPKNSQTHLQDEDQNYLHYPSANSTYAKNPQKPRQDELYYIRPEGFNGQNAP